MNRTMQILHENASTFRERREINALMESEQAAIGSTMVTNLYNSIVEKSHVNFEDIPQSKGDITRYAGYGTLMSSLELVKKLSTEQNVKIDEISIIEKAIDNITVFRGDFEKGFRLDKEFIILNYNTLVYSVVEAVSSLIANYVNFVKQIDKTAFEIKKSSTDSGQLLFRNLQDFNASVKSGDFQKMLHSIIDSGRENFIGTGSAAALALVGALAVVPITRELIFTIYYSRMTLSDHLDQQASLIEVNRQSVEASGRSARDKKEILRKQDATIKKMHQLSDRIRVDRAIGSTKTNDALKKENREWKIDTVRSQSASDSVGFQML